jgi:hypothetical protein
MRGPLAWPNRSTNSQNHPHREPCQRDWSERNNGDVPPTALEEDIPYLSCAPHAFSPISLRRRLLRLATSAVFPSRCVEGTLNVHTPLVKPRRRREMRRMSLLLALDFQKRLAAATLKNQPERARCCLTFAVRVSIRRVAHEDLGLSEVVGPYRSRSDPCSSPRRLGDLTARAAALPSCINRRWRGHRLEHAITAPPTRLPCLAPSNCGVSWERSSGYNVSAAREARYIPGGVRETSRRVDRTRRELVAKAKKRTPS